MMWKAFIFAEVDHRPPGAALASGVGSGWSQDRALWWGHVPGQPLSACVCVCGCVRVWWVGAVLVNGAPSLLSLSPGAPHRARGGWGPDWEGALWSRPRGWASLGPPVTQVLFTAGHFPLFRLRFRCGYQSLRCGYELCRCLAGRNTAPDIQFNRVCGHKMRCLRWRPL